MSDIIYSIAQILRDQDGCLFAIKVRMPLNKKEKRVSDDWIELMEELRQIMEDLRSSGFHFDLETHQPELTALKTRLERRVLQLGAVRTNVWTFPIVH